MELADVVSRFHKLYYESASRTWANTFWLGRHAMKCPLDLWIYQELIVECRPDVIIESGTYQGGTTLFLASVCDMIGNGQVITIDNHEDPAARQPGPPHKRITYLLGDSTSREIVETLRAMIGERDKVMVVLDSDHRKEHVLAELMIYGRFVTKGCYIIVEDTNVNGHPVDSDYGPGPMEAVEEFLKSNRGFVIDREREKFYLTFNPSGYLKRME